MKIKVCGPAPGLNCFDKGGGWGLAQQLEQGWGLRKQWREIE